MKHLLLTLLLIQLSVFVFAQTVVPLYKGNIPNSKNIANRETSFTGADGKPRITKVSVPTLTVFLPAKDKANGTAVIICPGGGYVHLSIGGEGYDVAKMFNEWGVAAFVLKYRLPDDSTMQHKEMGPLQDAQRAIQLVRMNAKEWNVNPNKVGIIGFSAGGHLAATAGTHYNKPLIPNQSNVSLRPDFMILLYAVISLTDSLSRSSKVLLGANPSQDMIKLYSNEFHVTANTPPAFIVAAKDDPAVNIKNSIYFYHALQRHRVRSSLHLYEKGGHGFGLNNKMSNEKWTDWLKVWMKDWL